MSRGYQQGDVLLKVSEIPEGAKKVKPVGGRLILAAGEATGHHHAIADCPEVDLFKKDGVLYLAVKEEPATLTHEEHGPIDVAPGEYEIGQVVEYDPFAEEVRRVAD